MGLLIPGLTTFVFAHESHEQGRLPLIGGAPEFRLTDQDSAEVSLAAFRGKVVVVTFIFTSCKDICPLLTAKMAGVQRSLGADFGPRVRFLSITVDPARDTPVVLKRYAHQYGIDLSGWSLLTGSPEQIAEVTRRYAVFHRQTPDGDVDHTFLTSIVDPTGTLRVQYLGVRFDSEEFLRDIRSLLREQRSG